MHLGVSLSKAGVVLGVKSIDKRNQSDYGMCSKTTLLDVTILYQLNVTMKIDRRKQQGAGHDGESGMCGR